MDNDNKLDLCIRFLTTYKENIGKYIVFKSFKKEYFSDVYSDDLRDCVNDLIKLKILDGKCGDTAPTLKGFAPMGEELLKIIENDSNWEYIKSKCDINSHELSYVIKQLFDLSEKDRLKLFEIGAIFEKQLNIHTKEDAEKFCKEYLYKNTIKQKEEV